MEGRRRGALTMGLMTEATVDRAMRGIYIGRFQPFHNGHLSIVEGVIGEVDELVLGVGSADQSHTLENPFTAGERVMMITKATAELDIVTYAVPIEDLNRNAVWVSHIESMSPEFDVAYSNNPLVIRLFEEAGIEVRQSEMYNRADLEGSEIRDRMVAGEDWQEFLPAAVVDVIEEIDGIGRIRQVSRSDGTEEPDQSAGDGSSDAAAE